MDNTIILLMISFNIFTDGSHFDRIQEHFKMAALAQGEQKSLDGAT